MFAVNTGPCGAQNKQTNKQASMRKHFSDSRANIMCFNVLWASGQLVWFCSFWLLLFSPFLPLSSPPHLHLSLTVSQTWRVVEETDGGEGGGLGAAGNQSVWFYMCLYILCWIYVQTKHGGWLQMEATRSRQPVCLCSMHLWTL